MTIAQQLANQASITTDQSLGPSINQIASPTHNPSPTPNLTSESDSSTPDLSRQSSTSSFAGITDSDAETPSNTANTSNTANPANPVNPVSSTHAPSTATPTPYVHQATPFPTPTVTPNSSTSSLIPMSPHMGHHPQSSLANHASGAANAANATNAANVRLSIQRESSVGGRSRMSTPAILSPTNRQESFIGEPTSEIKNLSEADRIANFVKFREFLISMINKNNQQPQPGLSLSPGKVEQTIKIRISGEGDNKIKHTDIDNILVAMSNTKTGVPLKDRKHRLRTYKATFLGSEALDWIVAQVDVPSRTEATELLQKLIDTKNISGLSGSGQIETEIYKFNDSKKKPPSKQTSLLTQNLNDTPTTTPTGKTAPDTAGDKGTGGKMGEVPLEREKSRTSVSLTNPRMEYYPLSPPISPVPHAAAIISPPHGGTTLNSLNTLDSLFTPASGASSLLSGTSVQPWSISALRNFVGPASEYFSTAEVKVEMDPSKTDRYEWLKMKHDVKFNPYVCFHFELHWLVCTGCVVDDFVAQCVRKAKQTGLVLVQSPISKEDAPFSAPLFVPLTPPKADPDMQQYILSKFNFVPDFVSAKVTQFTHSSGLAFIQVVDTGFLWFINSVGSVRSMVSAMDNLQRQFIEMCESINARYMLAAAQYPTRRLDFDENKNNNNTTTNNNNNNNNANNNNNDTPKGGSENTTQNNGDSSNSPSITSTDTTNSDSCGSVANSCEIYLDANTNNINNNNNNNGNNNINNSINNNNNGSGMLDGATHSIPDTNSNINESNQNITNNSTNGTNAASSPPPNPVVL